MKQLVRMLLGVIMMTALVTGVAATGPLMSEASAATYVSTAYTSPKKGETNAGVTALQRRLDKANVLAPRYLTGYFGSITETAVKRFQRRYHLQASGKVTRTTWKVLVAKTGRIKISAVRNASGTLDRRCIFSGRALCADKTRDRLYYVHDGKIVKTMAARFGCWNHRTREGRFTVRWKSRHHVSTIYHTPMPYAMFFSGGQAVHYSADFAARGYNGCSHGCVNVRAKSTIRWVFDRIRVGDRVVVYRS